MKEQVKELQPALAEYVAGTISRRTFMIRASVVGLGVAASGSLLAACAPTTSGQPTGDPAAGGVFREGYNRDFTPVDPVANAWADPTFNAFFEALVIRDPEGSLVPSLADEFSTDDSGWAFHLREGLKFQSGAPLTPEIVKENFELFRLAGTGQNAGFWAPITEILVDGQTITCVTAGPFGAFQEVISTEYSYILNPAAREEAGENWGSTTLDGTGPFVLDSFNPGDKVVASRWEDYPGTVVPFFENKGKAYLDGIEWVAITQGSQRAPEIETGNVDAIKNPPPQDIDRLKSNPDLVVQEFQELSNFFLSLNMSQVDLGFDDLKVRQAISHAIDRESIVKSIFLNHAAATYGPIYPGYTFYNPAVENFNQFDTEVSADLFEEAGWTLGSDGVRTKDGKRLSFEIVNLTDTTENQVMQAVAQMLADVGVEMTVSSLQGAAFFPYLAPTTVAFGFKWLWSSPMDVVEIFGTAWQPENETTARSHELYSDWQVAPDVDALRAAAEAYQAYHAENLLVIPIFTPNTVWVNRTNVVGWSPNQVNLYPFYNDVWLAQ